MRRALLLIPLLIGFGVGTAMADIIAIGEPVLIGSWGQSFRVSGDRNFDRIEVKMMTPMAKFELPTLIRFDQPTWGVRENRDDYAKAEGPRVDKLDFMLAVIMDVKEPFRFNFSRFDRDFVIEKCDLDWNGIFWNKCSNPVPEPSEAILLVCALGMVALASWKLK